MSFVSSASDVVVVKVRVFEVVSPALSSAVTTSVCAPRASRQSAIGSSPGTAAPSSVAVTVWMPDVASAATQETSPALPTDAASAAPSNVTVGAVLSIVMTSCPTSDTLPPLSVAR